MCAIGYIRIRARRSIDDLLLWKAYWIYWLTFRLCLFVLKYGMEFYEWNEPNKRNNNETVGKVLRMNEENPKLTAMTNNFYN